MSRSTSTRNRRFRRIALAGVAAALLVPTVASAEAPNPNMVAEETPAAVVRDLPPANPTQTAPEVISVPKTLADLPPADPTDVGQPVVPITLPSSVPSSFGTPGRIVEPTTLPDLPPAGPTQLTPEVISGPETLRDLAPANPTQIAPEVISGPETLPDLPPANPTQVAPVVKPAGNGGFDFGDAAIGVAVVAGFCAMLFALAAFLMGWRRRLGASHS